MRLYPILGLACILVGVMGFKHIQDAPDLSTPSATALSLLDAYSHHDAGKIVKCVVGGVTTDIPSDVFSGMIPTTGAKSKNIVVEMNGDTAKVAIEYVATLNTARNSPAQVVNMVDMLVMKKDGANWLVVPDKMEADATGSFPLAFRPLSIVAAIVGPDPGYRNAIVTAKVQAVSAACLSNSKQIALGMMMYTQDYDERMPRSAAGYDKLVFPYIKNEDVFRCNLDAQGSISYSMNVALQNRTLAEIANPANTVMLYEGHNGIVNYRHDGKAAIAFTDGHAKLMTAEEMKSVIWKLPPPAPKKAPAKKKSTKGH